MVQASKNNTSLHKIPSEVSKKEVSKKEISKKEVLKKEVSKSKITNNELSNKKKPSIHISFHNPNSKELTISFLTKVLAQRVAEEMRKGPCK